MSNTDSNTARAAAPDEHAMPESMEPAAVAGYPSDDELLTLDQLRNSWNVQADAANSWDELGADKIVLWAQKQALNRWGRTAAPPAPAEGEVEVLSPKEIEAQDAFTQMRDEILNLSDGLDVNDILSIIDSYTPKWV